MYTGEGKQYCVDELPPYLMLHFNRFTKNQFFVEKNPTIVNFFLKNLDMTDCLSLWLNSISAPHRCCWLYYALLQL